MLTNYQLTNKSFYELAFSDIPERHLRLFLLPYNCLKFIQQKTGKKIILPLHPTVINILQKNGITFPKSLDIITYNEQIKLIARTAGINQILNAQKRIGHRSIAMIVEKWETITSHIGRRSFATNFYGKIPTPLLIQATVHSTEQMFLQYINPIDNSRIIALSDYFDRTYEDGLSA